MRMQYTKHISICWAAWAAAIGGSLRIVFQLNSAASETHLNICISTWYLKRGSPGSPHSPYSSAFPDDHWLDCGQSQAESAAGKSGDGLKSPSYNVDDDQVHSALIEDRDTRIVLNGAPTQCLRPCILRQECGISAVSIVDIGKYRHSAVVMQFALEWSKNIAFHDDCINSHWPSTAQPAYATEGTAQEEMTAEYADVLNVTPLPLVASEPASNVVRYWLPGRLCSLVRYFRNTFTSPENPVMVLDGRNE